MVLTFLCRLLVRWSPLFLSSARAGCLLGARNRTSRCAFRAAFGQGVSWPVSPVGRVGLLWLLLLQRLRQCRNILVLILV